MCMCTCVKVYVYAHMYLFMTVHNVFMFFATSLFFLKHIHVIMHRHGHHNILNGIVWVQTGHSTYTFTATWFV